MVRLIASDIDGTLIPYGAAALAPGESWATTLNTTFDR